MAGRRPHDEARRRQARQVFQAKGGSQAAEVLGIPERTIRRWAKQGGWTRTPAQVAQTRTLAARQAWTTRRRHTADRLGILGGRLIERIEAELAADRRLNLRDAGILLGITLEKAELLSAPLPGADEGDGPLTVRQEAETWLRLEELLAIMQARADGDDDRTPEERAWSEAVSREVERLRADGWQP